jgi:hypothetical protein
VGEGLNMACLNFVYNVRCIASLLGIKLYTACVPQNSIINILQYTCHVFYQIYIVIR